MNKVTVSGATVEARCDVGRGAGLRRSATWAVAIVVVLMAARAARAQSSLPDPGLTPGAINPVVTQENIAQTICVPGWTRTVRPPREFTSQLKREQIRAAGFGDRRVGRYEEDHLVPLGVGGAPSDPRNLWPEPREPADGWGADLKDTLEYQLNRLVCAGQLSLAEAQRPIATGWIDAYRRHVLDGREPVAEQ